MTRSRPRKRKSPAQLNREIAEALARRPPVKPRRHHASVQVVSPADTWDVAMDALLEHDPARAAEIVNRLKTEHGLSTEMTPAFSKALGTVPKAVRAKFENASGIVSKYSYDWPAFTEGATQAFWASPYITAVGNLYEDAREQNNPVIRAAFEAAHRALSPGPGGRWEDVMPEPAPAARTVAKKFAKAVLDQLTDEQISEVDEKFFAKDAGYYGAMESQGEGVGWHDEGVDVDPPDSDWENPKLQNAIYAAVRRKVREAGIRLPR